jgi:hypothetical protein
MSAKLRPQSLVCLQWSTNRRSFLMQPSVSRYFVAGHTKSPWAGSAPCLWILDNAGYLGPSLRPSICDSLTRTWVNRWELLKSWRALGTFPQDIPSSGSPLAFFYTYDLSTYPIDQTPSLTFQVNNEVRLVTYLLGSWCPTTSNHSGVPLPRTSRLASGFRLGSH